MKAKLLKLAALTTASFGMVAANAAPVDFSPLTSGIDWSTVQTAILAVAASLITLYVAIKGARIVIRMVRGG